MQSGSQIFAWKLSITTLVFTLRAVLLINFIFHHCCYPSDWVLLSETMILIALSHLSVEPSHLLCFIVRLCCDNDPIENMRIKNSFIYFPSLTKKSKKSKSNSLFWEIYPLFCWNSFQSFRDLNLQCCRDPGGGVLRLQSDSQPLPVYHAISHLIAKWVSPGQVMKLIKLFAGMTHSRCLISQTVASPATPSTFWSRSSCKLLLSIKGPTPHMEQLL